VHGRLKPSNILAVNDQLKLSADSLLVAGEPAHPLSAPGIYDAPECAAGPVTPAADLWSLGVLIVEALTQHPPLWDRSSPKEPVVPRSVPQPFAAIARECMQIAPERRCTLSGVKARLNAARSYSQTAGESDKTVSVKISVAAFVAMLLVLAAIITTIALHFRSPAPSPVAEEQSAPGSALSEPVQPPAAKPSAGKPTSAPPGVRSITQRPAASTGAAGSGGVLQQVMPEVSERARQSIRGTVSLTIRDTVDARGNVTAAELDSPNASKYFANLALQAARSWKFKPAASAWLLRFQFTQSGTMVTPVQVTQ
jgi:TonB family protein